jgi:hypothetical protein
MAEIFEVLMLLLIPLALIAALVYVVVALIRRKREFAEVDPGIGTVRRLYFYVVSFVALMMAANGVVLIARYVLDAAFGGDVLSPSRGLLAFGLALTIVGLPLWALHWRMIGKYVRELPVETRSVVRKGYVYLVLGVAVGVGVGAAVELVQWAFRTESFSGYPWAAIVVWGALWAFHWRLESRDGQTTPETRGVRRLYLYLVAAVTLVMGALGLGQLIHVVFREAYGSLAPAAPLLSRSGLWAASTRDTLAALLVVGPVWAAHWLYFARRDYKSVLRQVYLYVLAIFGGVVTVLTALGIALYGVLVWTIGVPKDEVAWAHFGFLPGALASLIVGGGVIIYHGWVSRWEVGEATAESRASRRSYPYVLALVGLVTLIVGIVALVNTALGILVEIGQPIVAGRDLWKNGFALSITLGVLGGPIWGYYWSAIQRRVNSGDAEERASFARRAFIFIVLGAAMLALLGSVSFLIFVFLKELLDGSLSEVLQEAKTSIAIIAPMLIFLPYYWMVYRADRREAPTEAVEERRVRKAVTVVLVGADGAAFLRELEAALGYGVSPIQWAEPDASMPALSEDGLQALARRISDAPGANVLVVPDGATFRVLPYH